MKLTTLLLTLLFAHCDIFAQHPSKISIDAGMYITDVLTPEIMYLNKDFLQGRVLFKDGGFYDAKLNYNLFNGEMMFISAQKDTLSIANNQLQNIQRVIIDSVSFIYDNGFRQLLMENSKVGNLSRRKLYIVTARDKIGAYNLPAPTASVASYNSLVDLNHNFRRLPVREDIKLELKTEYAFGDSVNGYSVVNKKNVEKIFSKNKPVLNTYLKQNNVDFKNEKDLKDFFTYMSTNL